MHVSRKSMSFTDESSIRAAESEMSGIKVGSHITSL